MSCSKNPTRCCSWRKDYGQYRNSTTLPHKPCIPAPTSKQEENQNWKDFKSSRKLLSNVSSAFHRKIIYKAVILHSGKDKWSSEWWGHSFTTAGRKESMQILRAKLRRKEQPCPSGRWAVELLARVIQRKSRKKPTGGKNPPRTMGNNLENKLHHAEAVEARDAQRMEEQQREEFQVFGLAQKGLCHNKMHPSV